jgi:hypothetical protein
LKKVDVEKLILNQYSSTDQGTVTMESAQSKAPKESKADIVM